MPAPSLKKLKGEYRAVNPPSGILAGSVQFLTDYFFGPGKWIGKAFMPLDERKGKGYNIFSMESKGGKIRVYRTRKIDTFIGKSAYDGRNSCHLVYERNNSFPIDSMKDELRMVNEKLFIGLGHMALGGGSINPSPFIVYGNPEKWVGAP